MSNARDISQLFAQLGGGHADYQEVGRETRALDASNRWPLLRSVKINESRVAPPVLANDRPSAAERGRSPFASGAPAAGRVPPTERRPRSRASDTNPEDSLGTLFARLAAGDDDLEPPLVPSGGFLGRSRP